MRRYLPRILAPRLRARIRSGHYTPEGLRRAFARCVDKQDGFDSLDVLTAALLNDGPPEENQVVLQPEMVPYQPTPARVVLELIARTQLGPDDVLYDLGSGLGHVVVLAALLSRAKARGVEIEPSYVDYSRRMAQRLNVRAEFILGDAREVPISDGTVFFLYTPFRGEMMQAVLARIPASARIVAHGPCSQDVSQAGRLFVSI